MAVYQIYKILFNRSRQGNLLSKMDGRSAYDKAQELLEEMLGGVLPLTKEKRDKTLEPMGRFRIPGAVLQYNIRLMMQRQSIGCLCCCHRRWDLRVM